MQLIYKTCHILSTFTTQCHSLHLHSQCLHIPLSPNISNLFTAIHCVGYTSPLIKPFTVAAGEMHCHAVMFRLQRRVTLCILILQSGVKAWSPVKVHSLNSFFQSCLKASLTIILCSRNY